MAGERRKRQQRVRHEAGGSTGTSADTQARPDASSATASGTDQSSTATTNNASTAVMTRPPKQDGGAGRGSGRGRGRRSGVAVATVDEKQYYQPVTIMESKGATPSDELDEEPRQYRRRGIVSNWSRYEERNPALDEIEDGRDYLIGEDFSAVLQQQSQGSGGGGHLRLRGEETWGFGGGLSHESGGQQHGLGALKMTDLANTIATIPFMEQLGIDDNRLPKQLAEYYKQIAEDNRRLYNPSDVPANVADTAELLEEQLQRLRLTFFDNAPTQTPSADDGRHRPQLSKDVAKKTRKGATVASNTEVCIDRRHGDERANQVKVAGVGGSIEGFDDSFASTFDFNTLDKALKDEIVQESSSEVKVDLTEKMCRAFGSDINDVGDDFGGFIMNDEEDTEEPVGTSIAQANLKQSLQKDPVDNIVNENEKVPQSSEAKSKTKTKKSKDNQNVSTKVGQDTSPLAAPGDDVAQELDFSSGNHAFSFGLPKIDPVSSEGTFSLASALHNALKSAPSKTEEDIDIFTPAENKSKKPNIIIEDQPVIDLNAPIVPVPVSLVTTKEDTKELEDWLDSVLDD